MYLLRVTVKAVGSHRISNADMKSGTHQLLVCADDANLLHDNIYRHKTQKTQKNVLALVRRMFCN